MVAPPRSRDTSPGACSTRTNFDSPRGGPHGPLHGMGRPPSGPLPSVGLVGATAPPDGEQRPAKRAAPEAAAGAQSPSQGATPLEMRLDAIETRLGDLGTFRDATTSHLNTVGAKLIFLEGYETETRTKVEGMQSDMRSLGAELTQGMPQLGDQVKANAADLAKMNEAFQTFTRDGRILDADLKQLKADLQSLHAQVFFTAAAAAPPWQTEP